MTDTSDPYQELYAYTMGRARFILQHVVDAQHAQAATSGVNSIGLVFGLVGLYLHLERASTANRCSAPIKRLAPESGPGQTSRCPLAEAP